MTTTYTLRDTFNNRAISRHRSLRAAVRAEISHARAIKRRNGTGSYIPTVILTSDGRDIYDEVIAIREDLRFS